MFPSFSLLDLVKYLALMICLLTSIAQASVPSSFTYQGRLTDADGTTLNEVVALTFNIYSDSLGTASVWSESHATVTITNGLFTVVLGNTNPLTVGVFNGSIRWLGISIDAGAELRPLRPLLSVPGAFQAIQSDTALHAKTIADNSVTTSKIVNGAIAFGDIGQNGATSGQVIKWNGSNWAAAADAVASNTSGWTDNGAVVALTNPTDTVALNTSLRLGRVNFSGDLGMSGQSTIYFGSANARLEHLAGNDMRWVGRDLSLMSTESVYFTEYGVATWAEFDNVNRRVGIGTINPDDRLHVENSEAGTCWLKIQGSHATQWGQTGLRIQTPANTWHLRQDLYTHANFPEGALSLYNSAGAVETMTWLENGNVGIGRTNPTRKLHVDGSIQIDDTLYAGAINPPLMAASRLPDEPGIASAKAHDVGGMISLTHDLQTIISRQITVPAAGYVLALGHSWITYDHTYNDYDAVQLAISEITTNVDYERTAHFGTSANVGTGDYSCTLNPHAVFRVTAAGSYTYYLLGKKFDAVSASVLNADLTLVYVPTAYGTVETTPVYYSTPPLKSIYGQSSTSDTEPKARSTSVDVSEELRLLRSEIELLKKRIDEKKQ